MVNIAFIHENIAFNTFLRKKEKLIYNKTIKKTEDSKKARKDDKKKGKVRKFY